MKKRVIHFDRYDTRLNDIKKPIELAPEVIQDLWAPDSYIHHAKVRHSDFIT